MLKHRISLYQETRLNRTLGTNFSIAAKYQIGILDRLMIRTGLSYNLSLNFINAYLLELGIERMFNLPFYISLSFLNDRYKQYNRSFNSIIPKLGVSGTLFVFEIGVNFRYWNSDDGQLWNVFHYGTGLWETILVYRLGCRLSFWDGRYTFCIEINNRDTMFAGNLGNWGLFIRNRLSPGTTVGAMWSFFLDIAARSSGGIAMSSTYYTLQYQAGIELSL